jgi:6-phosphogluconolactonase
MSNIKHEIQIAKNLNELTVKAADYFLEVAAFEIHKKGFFSVAFCGGELINDFYKELALRAKNIKNFTAWDRIHFFWNEEFLDNSNNQEANFSVANKLFFNKLSLPSEHIHYIKIDQNSNEETIKQYQKSIKKIFMLSDNEYPNFDLMILNSDFLIDVKNNFINEKSFFKIQLNKLIMNNKVINNSARVVFLLSGIENAQLFDQITNYTEEELDNTTHSIKPSNGKILWLVDKSVVLN